jgi:hypothetical protein
MKQAFTVVKEEKISIRKAAEKYGVNHVSLSRRVSGAVPVVCKPGPPTVLTAREEEILLKFVLDMADRGFGMTITDVRELAVRIVKQSGSERKCCFSGDKAGWDWYRGFKARHPQLALRKAEPMSAQRINNTTPEVIKDYFEKLAAILIRLEILNRPMQVFNADESGITCVHKPGKILTKLGKKAVFAKVSGERGTTTTILCAGSASGLVLPPMMIFKGKRLSKELTTGGVPGAYYAMSENGWSNRDLFFEWIKFFVANVPPARPILLILDGHESHMSLEALQFALANGVHLLCLPSHTTHVLQPLDVAVFGPLKKAIDKVSSRFMREHPHARITRYDLPSILNQAWYEGMQPSHFISGFRTTGICPLDPGKVLDRLPNMKGHLKPEVIPQGEASSGTSSEISIKTPTSLRLEPILVLPDSPKATKKTTRSLTSMSQVITEESFMKQLEDRRSKKTTSSNSSALSQNREKSSRSKSLKVNPTLSQHNKRISRPKSSKVNPTSTQHVDKISSRPKSSKANPVQRKTSTCPLGRDSTVCQTKSSRLALNIQAEEHSVCEKSSLVDEVEELQYPCKGCGVLYGDSELVWIQCDICNKWECEDCAEIDPVAPPDKFICFICCSI